MFPDALKGPFRQFCAAAEAHFGAGAEIPDYVFAHARVLLPWSIESLKVRQALCERSVRKATTRSVFA